MELLSLLVVFIFGIIIGSFLNVVSLRLNTGVGLGGRSRCMSCSKQLDWFELIPVLSFIIQGGTCRKCKSKISWQYPLVELCTGIIFVLIFIFYPPISAITVIKIVLYLIVTCLLIVISVYDIKHKIIPDNYVYIFIIFSLFSLFVGSMSLHIPSIIAFISGPILALPFALIWLFSKGTWMGLGDAKLILGIGWILGLGGGLNAIILSFWIASLVALIWVFIIYKTFKPKAEIPFGPFLILGMYIVLFFQIQIIDISVIKEILIATWI